MNKPIQILILDDNAADADLIKRELRKAGFDLSTEWAHDKASFVQALDKCVPDAILADYSMPGFGGLAAIALARERRAEIPVIIVSGAIGEEIAIETLKAGATDYVLKDRMSRLGFAVRRALDEAEQLAEKNRAEKALRDSEERLRLALDAGDMGTVDYNLVNGRVVGDERAKSICEIFKDEMPFSEALQFIHPDDLQRVALAMEEATSPAAPKLIDIEIRVGQAGEEFRWIAVKGRTYFAGKGLDRRAVRIIATVMDITQRKQGEEQLKKTAHELARSNKDLEQFAYVASHDLQEPLRTVRSFVQMLEKRYRDQLDQDANDCINFAVDGAARMQTLIEDLLAYSRVGSQGKPFVPMQAEDALSAALLSLKENIENAEALVTHDPLPMVRGDRVQITQLFQNFIGNAIKFHRDGVRPEVHIGAKENPHHWLFRVMDNGIGIDPKYHDRIFTIFQRLHTTEKYKGTGIGLAICKRIIERHGGEICLDSKPGEGAVFYFSLPKV